MPIVDLPDGRLAYSRDGAGPPLVFVHGVAVDGRLWREAVPRLADGHEVVVLDLPLGAQRYPVPAGSDLTPPGLARLVAQALEALDLQDVTLVGNDTGGGICQLVVAHAPDRVGRLVLTNCDAYDAFPPLLLRPLCALARRRPRALDILLRGLRTRAGRTLLAFPVLARRDPELLRSWMAPVAADAATRRVLVDVLAGLEPRHHRDALPALRAFTGPVLLAWAPGDPLVPVRLARRLATDLPQARLVLLARGRTFTPLDQPERLAEAIAAFAAGPSRQPPTARERTISASSPRS
jgi:pimeloyl-ACP methyl ester carboxylesterase